MQETDLNPHFLSPCRLTSATKLTLSSNTSAIVSLAPYTPQAASPCWVTAVSFIKTFKWRLAHSKCSINGGCSYSRDSINGHWMSIIGQQKHLPSQTVSSVLLSSRLSPQTKLKRRVCVLINSVVCGSQKAQVNGTQPNPPWISNPPWKASAFPCSATRKPLPPLWEEKLNNWCNLNNTRICNDIEM